MKKPGLIIKLPDARLCIVYAAQPLAGKGMVVLNLVDEKYNLLKDADGREKTLIKKEENYNKLMKECTFVGMVD